MSNQPFNANEHPRGNGGKFAQKVHGLSNVTLDGPSKGFFTEDDNDPDVLKNSPDKDGDGPENQEPFELGDAEGDFPSKEESVFGPDADEGDDILKNSPSQDGDGNHQPMEFEPYEGDFPRKEESVFGPDADEGDDILNGSPSQDGDGNHQPFKLDDEGDFNFPSRR